MNRAVLATLGLAAIAVASPTAQRPTPPSPPSPQIVFGSFVFRTNGTVTYVRDANTKVTETERSDWRLTFYPQGTHSMMHVDIPTYYHQTTTTKTGGRRPTPPG